MTNVSGEGGGVGKLHNNKQFCTSASRLIYVLVKMTASDGGESKAVLIHWGEGWRAVVKLYNNQPDLDLEWSQKIPRQHRAGCSTAHEPRITAPNNQQDGNQVFILMCHHYIGHQSAPNKWAVSIP